MSMFHQSPSSARYSSRQYRPVGRAGVAVCQFVAEAGATYPLELSALRDDREAVLDSWLVSDDLKVNIGSYHYS
jgi:hypothetical protein